jgi:hypothetical protein
MAKKGLRNPVPIPSKLRVRPEAAKRESTEPKIRHIW